MKIKLWDANKWLPEPEAPGLNVSVDCVLLLETGTLTSGYYNYESEEWTVHHPSMSPVTHWREVE